MFLELLVINYVEGRIISQICHLLCQIAEESYLLLAYFTATVAATVGPAYIRLTQLSAGGEIGTEQRKKCSPSSCSDSSDISDSISVPKAQNLSENR